MLPILPGFCGVCLATCLPFSVSPSRPGCSRDGIPRERSALRKRFSRLYGALCSAVKTKGRSCMPPLSCRAASLIHAPCWAFNSPPCTNRNVALRTSASADARITPRSCATTTAGTFSLGTPFASILRAKVVMYSCSTRCCRHASTRRAEAVSGNVIPEESISRMCRSVVAIGRCVVRAASVRAATSRGDTAWSAVMCRMKREVHCARRCV